MYMRVCVSRGGAWAWCDVRAYLFNKPWFNVECFPLHGLRAVRCGREVHDHGALARLRVGVRAVSRLHDDRCRAERDPTQCHFTARHTASVRRPCVCATYTRPRRPTPTP